MNNGIRCTLFILVASCATASPPNQPQSNTVSDEAAIRSLEEQGRLGVLNRDSVPLQRLWADGFMVNAPTNRIAPNRAVVLDLLRRGLIHYAAFESTIEQIRIDGDIAIVMGGETVHPTGQAPLAGQIVRRRFTHVWRRDAGTWRLIARHANIVGP